MAVPSFDGDGDDVAWAPPAAGRAATRDDDDDATAVARRDGRGDARDARVATASTAARGKTTRERGARRGEGREEGRERVGSRDDAARASATPFAARPRPAPRVVPSASQWTWSAAPADDAGRGLRGRERGGARRPGHAHGPCPAHVRCPLRWQARSRARSRIAATAWSSRRQRRVEMEIQRPRQGTIRATKAVRPAARANASRRTRGTCESPPFCGKGRGILAYSKARESADRSILRAGCGPGARPAGAMSSWLDLT